jgi:hypothetical protein
VGNVRAAFVANHHRMLTFKKQLQIQIAQNEAFHRDDESGECAAHSWRLRQDGALIGARGGIVDDQHHSRSGGAVRV